jgi:hypothetical protein
VSHATICEQRDLFSEQRSEPVKLQTCQSGHMLFPSPIVPKHICCLHIAVSYIPGCEIFSNNRPYPKTTIRVKLKNTHQTRVGKSIKNFIFLDFQCQLNNAYNQKFQILCTNVVELWVALWIKFMNSKIYILNVSWEFPPFSQLCIQPTHCTALKK